MSILTISRCLCVLIVIFAGICMLNAETGHSCHGNREDDDNTIKSRPRPSEGQCGLSDRELPDLEAAFDDMALIPGGYYSVGTDDPMVRGDNEGPARRVRVNSFFIDRHEVSNEAFMKFTEDTGYVTDAEHYDDSFVFEYFLTREQRYEFRDKRAVAATWWYKVPGATWRHPEGMFSSIKDRMSHPVVHVSWFDAIAYCKWKTNGGRLPTEIEWETACRGGKKNKLFPWGDTLLPKGKHMTNIWQGHFPYLNEKLDGYIGTCPVDEYPANYYGLHNMVGNVWEWTSTHWLLDKSTEDRVKKGGSFLCHKEFCYRYRCAARSSNTPDSTASNLGFRCALNAEKKLD